MSIQDSGFDEVQRKNDEFAKLLAAEHPVDPQFRRLLIEAAKGGDEARVDKIMRTVISMHAMETATAVKAFLEEEYQRFQHEQKTRRAQIEAAMAAGSKPRRVVVPGTRVVAICDDNGTDVRVFGYGVYEGEKPCPYLGGAPNPYIKMDDGTHMWGMICWWSPEAEYRASEEFKRPQKPVTVKDPIMGPAAPLPSGVVDAGPETAMDPVAGEVDAAVAEALKDITA